MANEPTPLRILDTECAVFSKYLVHQIPTPYILAKYREAHQASPKLARPHPSPFDNVLVELSRKHTATTKLVDAYTALFFRDAMVRKKMVLLLAILESSAPTYPIFDQPDAGGGRLFLLRFVIHGILFAFALVLASVMLLPLHLGFELGIALAPVRKQLAANLESFGAGLPSEGAQSNPAPPSPTLAHFDEPSSARVLATPLPRGEGGMST